MSVTMTKATITGSELPIGDLYSYAKDLNTNVMYVYKTTGSPSGSYYPVTRQAIPTFPPTSYTESFSTYRNITANDTGTNVIEKLEVYPASYGPNFLLVTTSGGTKINLTSSSALIVSSAKCTLLACKEFGNVTATYGNASVVFVGLGIDTIGGINYYVNAYAINTGATLPGAPHTVGINGAYCVADDNGVKCFGTYLTGNVNFNGYAYCYALLNPDTGYMVKLTYQIQSTNTTLDATYQQLVIPSGGTIKHFANGYYLCTDGSSNLYLYSINNGGEFVCQLDPGSYNPDTAIEFLDLI